MCALFLTLAVTLPPFVLSHPSVAAPHKKMLRAAEDRLDQLISQQEIVGERLNQAQEELDKTRAEMARLQVQVGRIRQRMGDQRAAAVSVARTMYEGGGFDALEVILSSKSLDDLDRNIQYLRSSEAAQTRVFEQLAVRQEALKNKLVQLDKTRRAEAAQADKLAAIRTKLNDKVASERDEIAKLQREIAVAERRRERRAERRARAAARRRKAAAAAAAAAAVQAQQTRAASRSIAVPPPSGYTPNPAPASGGAGIAVRAALSQVGKPYQWGAAGPNSYDCSGLTMWSWAHAGVSLPHSSASQYSVTARVARSDLQPGDLVFFGSPIHHVAMYIGNGQMVEAPYTGANVRVVPLRSSDYVGAGRPGV
ncbi:MAG: NlpC/P60 family protein [Actinomycetota bacterium]|nr:NlpC/P60 family protein [Actinomycetota bacterium]